MRVLNLRDTRSLSGTLGLGLVFAIAGFCLALANAPQSSSSSDGSDGGSAADVRAVGTYIPLRFTNPKVLNPLGVALVPTEYDLGDACFGSVITRYCTAEGGLRPYRFTSTGNMSLANITANTGSTLSLGIAGGVTGKTPDVPPGLVGSIPGVVPTFLQANGPTGKQPGLRFLVTLADASGSNNVSQNGNFNLFLFNSNFVNFRFAMDTLPTARLGTGYSARLDLLNGKAPIKMSALSVVNKTTGAPVTLAELGLFLGTDGSLIGKPLAVGNFLIFARAIDASGQIAKSRKNPNVTDQLVELAITDNPVTSSDVFTQSCKVSGTLNAIGRDSLKYKGIINVLGNDTLKLSGSPFQFNLGGITFSGKLGKNGSYKAKLLDKSTFSFKVNGRSGKLDISISKSSFTSSLDLVGLKTGELRRPIQIMLGESVVGTEVLDFSSLVDGTDYQLNYELGRSGRNASGGFQIVSVRGKDDVAFNGQPGDAWRVGFMAQPRSGVTNPNGLAEGFDFINAINVRIGANVVQTIKGGGIANAGPGIKFQGGPVDNIKSFSLDATNGKGNIQTRTLAAIDTAIPQASKSLAFSNIYFPLGVDIMRGLQGAEKATFVGEHARKIFNKGKTYSDVAPGNLTSGR